MILAIDPSINSMGVALFGSKLRNLLAATTIKTKKPISEKSDAERCALMVGDFNAWLYVAIRAIAAYGGPQFDGFKEIVFEWPRIYPGERGKRPNDLMGLVGVGMYIAGTYSEAAVHSYYPSEWAGQVPKAKGKQKADESARAIRIKDRLWSGERMHWPTGEHDAIDAIGIGLHHLGRFKPTLKFPGAK